MTTNKNSKARIAANNRYNAKVYDRINIAVPKGRKEDIQAVAQKNGESVNAWLNRLIDEELERVRQCTGGGYDFEAPQGEKNP